MNRDVHCNECGGIAHKDVPEGLIVSAICKPCEDEKRPQWEARQKLLAMGVEAPPQPSTVNYEKLFDEWRELFTLYRRDGKLPKVARARFKELSLSLSLWLKKVGDRG